MFQFIIFSLTPLIADVSEEDVPELPHYQSRLQQHIPRFAVKTNLTTLIDPSVQSVYFSGQKVIAPRFSISTGAGWFFNSLGDLENKGERLNGLRFRQSAKFHPIAIDPLTLYVGGQFMLNYLSYDVYRLVCRAGCQYQEEMLTNFRMLHTGVSLISGTIFYFGESKRFFIELYSGIGFKYKDLRANLPKDSDRNLTLPAGRFNTTIYREPGTYFLPDLILGVYFGYTF